MSEDFDGTATSMGQAVFKAVIPIKFKDSSSDLFHSKSLYLKILEECIKQVFKQCFGALVKAQLLKLFFWVPNCDVDPSAGGQQSESDGCCQVAQHSRVHCHCCLQWY
jgi:hypothetical protein